MSKLLLGTRFFTMENCIFCNIISGKDSSTKIEYENEELVVFKDIRPASTCHYLAVPRKHQKSVRDLHVGDEDLLRNMEESLKKVIEDQGVPIQDARFGFHLPPFISVHHLHMHGIAPVADMKFISRLIFRPDSAWFSTPGRILGELKVAEEQQ